MKETKKIEKELLFKNNIKDITSISLDTDYKIDNNKVVGNFIVSGDYKIHEISLNREKFNFKIPFKESINNDIESESVKIEISNFEYDFRKDELLVNIEYMITGDRKDVLIFDTEESLDEYLESKEIEVIDTRISDIKETLENSINNNVEENILHNNDENKSDIKVESDNIISNEDRDEKLNTDIVINNIETPKDNFITYKIYKIKETDTLESIVLKYKTSMDDLKDYNDLNNIKINDKIIIPYYE